MNDIILRALDAGQIDGDAMIRAAILWRLFAESVH